MKLKMLSKSILILWLTSPHVLSVKVLSSEALSRSQVHLSVIAAILAGIGSPGLWFLAKCCNVFAAADYRDSVHVV